MVKKHKGGRRQILQLEDKKFEDKKPSRNEWEPTSTAALNKEATPLDSQVADFFKEIDALTVSDHGNDGSSEASELNDVASCSKEREPEDLRVQEEQPEKSDSNQNELPSKDLESYCSWQEICDKNTGYVYYWNTETNDVTWDCPAEYIMYLKCRKSVDGEDFSQSNQLTSHENLKKAKRKKDPPKPPEGAIIPISYFGDSSTDESSDEDKDNGFTSSVPHFNHKTESKVSVPSKQRTNKKDDCHINESKKEQVETMGPHLPPDHQISKMVSSASRTSFLCVEEEASSKNEVDEYLEIGPQLASNYEMDISKNSDCNTVSDSSSKCSNVTHSVKNGPGIASSSTNEEPWEVSLLNIEKKFKGLDQDIGEESPDSTVRKVDTSSENSMPCQTTNWTVGIRGVVEYDDFTDEEEEMCSSNISSSKQESDTTFKPPVSSGSNEVKDWTLQFDAQRKYDCIKTEVSQSETQRNLPKRKFLGKTDDYVDTNFKKSKQKIDIDRLFNNHSNSHKYGFGFSRQEQLNIESDFFCSTSSHNQLGTSKGSRDYKTINFVKSDHVFDLSTLNNDISNDSFSQSKPEELDKSNSPDNIYVPGPSRLNGFKEISESKTMFNESNDVNNDDSSSKVKKISTSKSINGKLNHNLNADVSYENKNILSENKNASSSKVNDNVLKMEEDIDEIDRQLSEAFEAKRTENGSSKPSSSLPLISSETNRIETDSSVSVKLISESAKTATDILNIRSLSDDIISLSSVLIDKLTFLISNHSTLTSLSSLLIQIQTRLIDWQAGSLESRYFMSRLQEVQQYLQHYEVGAVSGDWLCQWDRENKRYFYMNTRTQQSQWTYPEELCGKENSWMPSSTELASTSASSDLSRERDELQTVSSSVPEGQFQNKSFSVESCKGVSTKYSDSSSLWISESSPPPPPPGVDSPPPPPPQSPPPDSPPPPPPDSTEVEDLLEDMDIENSDDSNHPLIVTNSHGDSAADDHTQYSNFPIPSPERSVETLHSASITNTVSSTSLSGFEEMNTVSKSPQLVTTSRDTVDTVDSVNIHWSMSQPSCSTDISINFDSESEVNLVLDQKVNNFDKDSDANASSSSRSCDINASSSSNRSCDINASSSSRRSCDVNTSSSSRRSCDVNTSSSSCRSYDVNASSSTNRNYICSNEVTTYRKPCGPYPSTSTVVSASTTTTSKKEKKKAKLSSGLALKKKNIPSLVEKWQKIKEEQEKEDKDTDDDPRN